MTTNATNLPASVHARLLNLAKAQARPFQEVLQFYAIERFLYRLAQSQNTSKFLLKGALLFYCRDTSLVRPTRDIDLEGFTNNSPQVVAAIIKDICYQTVVPDGMEYEADSVQATDTQGMADYQGVRVRFVGRLGAARIPMQVDVGFADKVTPGPVWVDYPTLLDMPAPQLRAYPYETMIAEKLQAIVALGKINTRMKDFYDLWQLGRKVAFAGPTLLQAVNATFQHRQTAIPADTPAGLSDEFAKENQRQWAAFLARIDARRAETQDFTKALGEIRNFLWPILEAATQRAGFDQHWPAGGPWR